MARLLKRFHNYKRASPHCPCTFLDPRFKSLLFDAETIDFIEQQLIEHGDDIFTTQLVTAQSTDSTHQVQTQNVELGISSTSVVPTSGSGMLDGVNTDSASTPSQSSGLGLWASLDQLSEA
jgi:hypothetical protein